MSNALQRKEGLKGAADKHASAQKTYGAMSGTSLLGALPCCEPMQRLAERENSKGDAIRQIAAEGLRGPSGSLPYHDRIQASFGRHDVSAAQAHTAPGVNAALGSFAYTVGNHTRT